jgi:ANTAR domain-containing protein
VDITAIVSEFIDEMLGLHGAYALTDIEEFNGSGDAAAFMRLRVRLCDALLEQGWAPSEHAMTSLEQDRRLLAEPDGEETLVVASSRDEDYAAIRARAQRVRADARRTSQLANERSRDASDVRTELAQMRRALESRAVIEQAKGIAMERYGLTADVAWAWLVRTSQNRNVKLRVVAEELVGSIAPFAQPAGGSADSEPKVSATSTPSA